MKKPLNKTSKFLSYILRHEPHTIGLQLDSESWADIDALIQGAVKAGHLLDRSVIQLVVADNDKKRFALSEDGQRIRAVQGYSSSAVEIKHLKRQPPETPFHGTATRFLDSILLQGLLAGSHHHVHLSQDCDTAFAVGKRYGELVILHVAALRMHQQGFALYQAEMGFS